LRSLSVSVTVDALIGWKPKDEIEGMIAAQLLACHNASMECYRRAMIPRERRGEDAAPGRGDLEGTRPGGGSTHQ
jgi:hypothetical protein